jgi:transcriptional regulator with XRE-family HTH domain
MMDSARKETFGSLLKKLRIEDAKKGLRAFAELIDWQPSNLSNVERGRAMPPADPRKIHEICDALGLSPEDPRRVALFDLSARERGAVPGDVAEAIKDQPGIPVLVRAVASRRLEDDQLRDLAEYIKKFY